MEGSRDERWREGGRKGGKERWRDGGREKVVEGGKGEGKVGREGGMEGVREDV